MSNKPRPYGLNQSAKGNAADEAGENPTVLGLISPSNARVTPEPDAFAISAV
jgi:hypothetical protein